MRYCENCKHYSNWMLCRISHIILVYLRKVLHEEVYQKALGNHSTWVGELNRTNDCIGYQRIWWKFWVVQ